MHHVVGIDAILTTVRFVAHDDDVVIGNERCLIRAIELLNERKYKARIALYHFHQFLATGCDKVLRIATLTK